MDSIKKFLRKLDRKRREKILEAIELIEQNLLDSLNIKPLKGFDGHFRCRTGDIRILFFRQGAKNVAYDINFRGQAYK